MPRYPHTKLFNGTFRVVVLSGPHIQVLDTQNGRIIYSTANVAEGDEDLPVTGSSGLIRCSGMSKDGRYLATAGDDKQLKIFDLKSFTLLSSRELSKKPTSIEFTRNTDILVSDKFGDVFRYELHPKNEQVKENASEKFASHENPSSGELILGHVSLLTSCLLTPDERFIITADRDEHIRVSWYPEGYAIESYCLGHKKYVSAIHIPKSSPASLISGGGDPELKVWDWMTGRLLRNITVLPAVEPFIKVAAKKQRHDASLEPEDHGPSECSNEPLNETAPVFVVRKIGSFLSGSETHVVFSVVGATAIFEFILSETDDQPDIRHHDFGKPVIEFTLCEEGLIWVLLDADFREESDVSGERPHKLIQAIQWSANQFVDAGNSALLNSLNTTCSLSATAENLKALDLYSDLSSLPKGTEVEQGSQVPERKELIHEPLQDEAIGEGASIPIGLTKRALGRLKHKRTLGQLHHQKGDDRNICRPDAKKVKADSDNEGSHT